LGVSCAKPVSQGAPAGAVVPIAAVPIDRADYDHPIPFGVTVRSFAAAQPLLAFHATLPTGLGSPKAILVTDPAKVGKEDRAIAFIYDETAYGRVVFTEYGSQETQAEWASTIQQSLNANGAPGTSGTGSAFDLAAGVRALGTTSEDGSTSDIRWLDHGIQTLI